MGMNLFLVTKTTATETSNRGLESFQGLPVLELASVCINLTLVLVFHSIVSARQVALCFGRIRLPKENLNGNSVANNQRGVLVGEESQNVVIGKTYKASHFCCFYVLLLHVLVLGFDDVGLIKKAAQGKGKGSNWTVMVLPAAQSLSWFVLSFSALYRKYKVVVKFPYLLRIWWVASFVICLCTAYADSRGILTEGLGRFSSHVLVNFAATPALCFLCYVSIKGVTGIEECRNSDLREPLLLEEEAGCLKVTPYSEAGLFSLLTLSWLNPLLSIGARKPLDLKDIPLLAPKDRSKTNYKLLNMNWEKLKAENPLNQPSLAWAILKSFWKDAACNAIFAAVNTLVSYVSPYMISYFVDYLGGKETFRHEGYILAGIFFGSKLVATLTTRQWYLGVDIYGCFLSNYSCPGNSV